MSRRQVEALLEESGDGLDAVDRAHVGDELGALLGLVGDTPPPPSPELAALLGSTAPSDVPVAPPARLSDRRLTGPRGAVTGAVVLAVATVGATGLSAAANSLPAPLQRHAAELSRSYLPFDFPRPRAELDHDLGLGADRPEQPAPAAEDEAAPDARVPLRLRPEARTASDPVPDPAAVRRTGVSVTGVPRPDGVYDAAPARATPTGRDRTAEPVEVTSTPAKRDRTGSSGGTRPRSADTAPTQGTSTTSSTPTTSSGEDADAQPPAALVASAPRPRGPVLAPLTPPAPDVVLVEPATKGGKQVGKQVGRGEETKAGQGRSTDVRERVQEPSSDTGDE